MNAYRRIGHKWANWAGRLVIVLVFAIGVTVLLFGLAGKFAPKISEDVAASEDTTPVIVAAVRLVRLPLVETAVGTIRPVHETTIGAKLLARVVEVNLKAGQVVKA